MRGKRHSKVYKIEGESRALLDPLGSLRQIGRMTYEPESMDDLGLDVRAYNAVRKMGCRAVADICSLTERDLLNMQNVGRVTVLNIKQALAKEGLELRG
jgi:DNA-directed RNA polymerase alpha subunit